jgi:PAS domain S-box-containing protein
VKHQPHSLPAHRGGSVLHFIKQYVLLTNHTETDERALEIRIFNSVCLSTLAFLAVLAAATSFVFVRKASLSLTFVAVALLLVVARALASRGNLRAGSALWVIGIWIVCTIHLFLSGEINTAIVGMYVALPVIAGILLGPGACTTIAMLSCGAALGLVLLPSIGYSLPHYYPMPPWSAWFVLVFLLILTIPPVNATLRGSADAREQARREILERKKAEQELAETGERYRNFFNTSRDPVFMTTLNGKFIDLNDAALEMFGYAPEERAIVADKSVESFYARPEDRETHSMLVSKLGFSKEHPVDLRNRAGEVVHTLVTTAARRDADGTVIGFQGTIRDITERRRSEEVLRNTLHRFYTILASTYAGVLIVTEEGRVEFANQSFCQLFDLDEPPAALHGITSREMLGKIKDVYANPTESNARILEVVAQNTPIRGAEIAMVKGRTYMVDFVPIMVEGQSCGRLWFHNDITERKRMEEALRTSEELYRNLFEQAKSQEELYRSLLHCSPDPIILYDMEGKVQYLNPAHANLFGWALDEVRGQRLETLPEWDREASLSLINDIATEGSARNRPYDTQRLAKDGRLVDVSVSGARYLDHKGDPAGTLVILHDITERKRADDEREKLRSQLFQAQKMEAVGILAGGVAHDFNNLLHIISGHAELLETELEEKQLGFGELAAIRRAAHRGADLVKQILTFSRRIETHQESLNLNEEIRNTERLLSRTLPKMIDIELRLQEGLRQIRADATQIEQMLINLAFNAKDAMPDGGRLTIETRDVLLDDKFRETHAAVKPGPYVLVTVSDTGRGMEKEVFRHIFEPFFTTKGLAEGTGLGLSSVFGLVKMHGGHITCESDVGKGTTFAIYFPALDLAKPRSEDTESDEAPATGSETILLVDDERHIRDLAKRGLEKAGYAVITGESGKDALEIYRREGPTVSLVILDLIMPEMGGVQCVEELLKIDPHVKILIASGYSVYGETKAFLDSRAKGTVSKPFNLKDLLRAVRDVLDSSSGST